ncbi:MAG: hypothetical protein GF308_02615 [Candidatus Heimdallarchaeota archaeon]|nr:hypothetical protein [Candidatus Heimdallarchaeota archaeon]
MMKKTSIVVLFVGLLLINCTAVKNHPRVFSRAEGATEPELAPSSSEETLTQAAHQTFGTTFLENQGQLTNEAIIYYASLGSGMIGFGESEISLWVEGWQTIVSLTFVDSQLVAPRGIDLVETKSHFFLGERGTYTNIQNVRTILYQDLWEGIDLYYKATAKGIKYEFRVAPRANPDVIAISCSGADSFSVTSDKITIIKDGQQFIDQGLTVFQADDPEITASLVTKGMNTFGFHIAPYDSHQPLIIDPLIFSTFVSGSDKDSPEALALDEEGNVYVTGATYSRDFPTTPEAYNETFGGLWDTNCFVFKLSADGSSLLYSTFIGGLGDDWGASLALDEEGNAIVTGKTFSSDFPTTSNAFNQTFGGGFVDCFVFKLAANGSSLLFSSFIGGRDLDSAEALTLDNFGNIYITGETFSLDFPTTSNAYNATFSKKLFSDCFVLKLAANGSSLLYSTFVGGAGDDGGASLALDEEENIYVTGTTWSGNFPTTAGTHNQTFGGGSHDCFVFKLSADGSSLLFSTFVGGNYWDAGESLVLDDEGNAYVTGWTGSKDFPTTAGAFDNVYNSDDWTDCFVFKLSADGSSLLFSTFIEDSDSGSSLVLDDEKNVYVTGITDSSAFPTTANAFNRTFGGGNYDDCFLLKLAADGSSLYYSTYLGGSKDDRGVALTLDNSEDIVLMGTTTSSNFPTTSAGYSQAYRNNTDCFLLKLSITDALPPLTITNPPLTTSDTQLFPLPSSSFLMTTLLIISTIVVIIHKRKKSGEKDKKRLLN